MNILSDVSETAVITLRARSVESRKEKPVIRDEMGERCLERMVPLLPQEVRSRLIDKKLPSTLTRYIALRARKYDVYAREFLAANPDGLVVSLGCGFDTRYWRVFDDDWNYVEVDLPTVIAAKRELLPDRLTYPTIACSVLEDNWLEEIVARQDRNVLFLAEGLFMYLPQADVEALFRKLADTFSRSVIVFETVTRKYTEGFRKKMVEMRMKRTLGSDAGASYQFGVNKAAEIESFGPGIRLIEEWSYFEDKDIEPNFLWHFRKLTFLTRTQWTIKAALG